jgi:hypothetical protein
MYELDLLSIAFVAALLMTNFMLTILVWSLASEIIKYFKNKLNEFDDSIHKW